MSLFSRLSATFTASVDKAVNQIENHDAIINAALRDTRQAAARARVRLAQVQRDGEKMRADLLRLGEDEVRWTDRARSVADDDEAQAFECLRRRKQIQQQIKSIKAALANHDVLEKRLQEDVGKIEQRLTEISQQRNALRSRESVAEARRIMGRINGDVGENIEETFERWEINIGANELGTPDFSAVDSLDAEFSRKEEQFSLRAELDSLLGKDAETRS